MHIYVSWHWLLALAVYFFQEWGTKTRNRSIKNKKKTELRMLLALLRISKFFVLPDVKTPIPDQVYRWQKCENLLMLIYAAVSWYMSSCLFASDNMTLAKLWGLEKQKRHPIPRTSFYKTKRKDGLLLFLAISALSNSFSFHFTHTHTIPHRISMLCH